LLLRANEAQRLGQVWTRTAWTDEKARFTIKNLPPGDYLGFAFEATEEGFWRDKERFTQFASRAKKVSIEKNGSATLNLEVTPLPQG
jgi:hypothetical protein